MPADIDIINAALNKLGEQVLTSVADVSVAGRLATATYSIYRDALLREHDWNFATKRASLTALAETPVWEFDFQYNLPGDCLRLIEIENPSQCKYRNEGRKILTDLTSPLKIKYVGSVEVGEMDATFFEALAQRLAMEWAEPISQTNSKTEMMTVLYQRKLQVAKVADGQTDQNQTMVTDDFVQARW